MGETGASNCHISQNRAQANAVAKLIRSKRGCWYLGISQFKTRSLSAIHLAFMLKLLLLSKVLLRQVSCDFSLPLVCHPRSHSVILIAVWQQPTALLISV